MTISRRALLCAALAPRLAIAQPQWRVRRPGATQPRVGVFGLFHPRSLTVRALDGAGLRANTDRGEYRLNGNDVADVREADGRLRVVCAGHVVESQRIEVAGEAGAPAAFELEVPGRITRRFTGRLEITTSAGALVPVIQMPVEDVVASVVAAEQASTTPLEALKAQSIAARSYLVAARGRHRGFDVCDTTHCQHLRECPAAAQPAAIATRATADLVVAFRGMPIAALYSSSCGGQTRTLAEAGFDTDTYPYFSVDCPSCRARAAEWERRLTIDADTQRLVAERSERLRLNVVRRNGWSAVPGLNFDAVRDAETVVLRGRGAGHGVGLCQAGAASMATAGAPFLEILRHYYPGTTFLDVHR
jgi:stage II sporulation protein D